jgi:hypothetical protein
LQTAFAIPSIFMAPISPRASTSSMHLVMIYLEVRPALVGKTQEDYIDAKGDKTRDFQLLEVNDLAFIRRRLTLSWRSGLLEGVGSRGFCALVAQESWRRYRGDGIFDENNLNVAPETPLKMVYHSEQCFTLCTVFRTSNR